MGNIPVFRAPMTSASQSSPIKAESFTEALAFLIPNSNTSLAGFLLFISSPLVTVVI